MSYFSNVDASKQRRIGTTARDGANNVYIYLSGVASLVATDFVTYDEVGVPARLVAGAKGPVAVAMAAVGATAYGWYQREGTAQGNTNTIADDGKVYATATAGRVDDAAVTGDQVIGAIARSADTSNIATFQLTNPWIGQADAVT